MCRKRAFVEGIFLKIKSPWKTGNRRVLKYPLICKISLHTYLKCGTFVYLLDLI